MKVVIAIDSFKGSMSSLEAGNAAKQGVLSVWPDAQVIVVPVADGGEGTVFALSYGRNMREEIINVTGPLGDKIEASYCIIDNTAVIEMSSAAGLTLVPEKLRNPMNTTTYGVGEMIKDAINKGCERFIVGIGGSATNDVGTGMLAALGYEFFDAKGNTIEYGGKGLAKVADIGFENVLPGLSNIEFKVACDVDNPLLGERGCSKIYARQKGASDEDIEYMENAIKKFADLTEHISMCDMGYLHGFARKHSEVYNRDTKGAGAAGGLGYAFLMYTNAKLMSGIDIVTEYIGIEEVLKDADLVITGEGKIDQQTMMGKTPAGISKIAKKYDIPVYAFAGMIDDSGYICQEKGMFDKMFQLKREMDSLDNLMKKDVAKKRLSEIVGESLEHGL